MGMHPIWPGIATYFFCVCVWYFQHQLEMINGGIPYRKFGFCQLFLHVDISCDMNGYGIIWYTTIHHDILYRYMIYGIIEPIYIHTHYVYIHTHISMGRSTKRHCQCPHCPGPPAAWCPQNRLCMASRRMIKYGTEGWWHQHWKIIWDIILYHIIYPIQHGPNRHIICL